jgi:uncharacterized membrane protein YidH (DUF202 family)
MKRMVLAVAFVALILGLAALPMAAAQTDPGVPVDPATVKTILNLLFIFGGTVTVPALTEMVKRLIWKDEATRPKWSGYLCSALVSIAAVVAYALIVTHWPVPTIGTYSFFVWLAANGFYKLL